MYWLMTLRPDSPSFFSASSVGITEVRSWMMIEAEMYGMMLSAKIAMRSTAPPENMLNSPSTPPDCVLEALPQRLRIDAGQRDVGAEPVDDQRAEREPDALLQLFGLGDRPEIDVRRKLLGCRGHGLCPQ